MATTAAGPKRKRNKALVAAKVQGILVALLMAPILGIVPLFGLGSGEVDQVAISVAVALVTAISAVAAILAFARAKTPERAKGSARFTTLPIFFAAVIFIYGLVMFGDASSNPNCNQLGCMLALSIGPMIMGYGAAIGLLSFGQFKALNRYADSSVQPQASQAAISSQGALADDENVEPGSQANQA